MKLNNGGDLYLTVKLGEDTITKVISNINRQNRISETVIRIGGEGHDY